MKNKKKYGFTLIEILLALSIIMVIVVSAFFIFKSVESKTKLDKEVKNLTYLKSSIDSIRDLNKISIDNTILEKLGILDTSSIDSDGNLKDAWGNVINFYNGNSSVYYITYNNLSLENCEGLATRNSATFGSEIINGFVLNKPTVSIINQACSSQNQNISISFSNYDSSTQNDNNNISNNNEEDSSDYEKQQEEYKKQQQELLDKMNDITDDVAMQGTVAYSSKEEAAATGNSFDLNDQFVLSFSSDSYANSVSIWSNHVDEGEKGLVKELISNLGFQTDDYGNSHSAGCFSCGVKATDIVSELLKISQSDDKSLLVGSQITFSGDAPKSLCSNSSFKCVVSAGAYNNQQVSVQYIGNTSG